MSSINEQPDRIINNYSRRRGGAGTAGFAKATVKFPPPKDLCSGYARALGPADAFKRDNVDEVSAGGDGSHSHPPRGSPFYARNIPTTPRVSYILRLFLTFGSLLAINCSLRTRRYRRSFDSRLKSWGLFNILDAIQRQIIWDPVVAANIGCRANSVCIYSLFKPAR